LILLAFVVVRLPVMLRQPGSIDEEFYAVPGWTIVRFGIPRAPHVPQRDPQRVFYRADEAFFVEPPLGFYWQALFFALLPDTYAAARIASGVAALATIWLVYELSRRLYRNEAAALWGAGLYSLFRTFYFPAMTGRPDMLCTALGLGALWLMAHWQERRDRRRLVAVGGLLGLGGLTHPLALVYALQIAGWLLLAGRGWKKLIDLSIVVIAGVAVFALWLALILRFPEQFRGQFLNHVHSGPGILERMLLPWESLRYHAWMMSGHLGRVQFWLLLGGWAVAVALHWRNGGRGSRIAVLLAASGVFLLATLAGVHPTQYYWCYPTALLCVCLGSVIQALVAESARAGGPRLLVHGAVVLLLAALMLPGAGVRTTLAYLRHWNDIHYNAPALARVILADLPPDARYTVDREYVLDFLAAGRQTLLAETFAPYFSAEQFPYDYLVLSRRSVDERTAMKFDGELIHSYGERDDPFACYVEVYRQAERSGAGP
jgi:4-amino-4-deoxy-L-arabinose transferase-like glycosyltransferase